MEGETLMFAQVMTVIVLSLASFVAIGLGARVLWRIGSRQSPRQVAPADDGRLQRLEQGMEAIAIEVERISEAQRFTVALLTERTTRGDRAAELRAPDLFKRENTPH